MYNYQNFPYTNAYGGFSGNQYNYMPNSQNGLQGQINGSILKVSGINGVNALNLAPNTSVLALDETAPIVWLVSADGAVEYAEDYVGEKMEGNAAKAQKFREMAMQEMQHATNWYDWTEKYGEELKAVMPLSAEDTEEWEACKRKYADKIAIIKYMLDR